jgi:hypothetical protein
MFWGTPSLQFVPWWVWAWGIIRSGNLPLWNPLLGMGAPLLANYQSGLMYPPNWLYFFLAEIGGAPWLAWGQAFLVAAHLTWAALGMGLLTRRLGLNELGQMISGLSFGLSGYIVARSGFLSINAAVAWVPWIMLGVTNLSVRGWGGIKDKQKEILGLSIVIGMQLLAGHAQVTWYTIFLAGFWLFYLAFLGDKFDGFPQGEANTRSEETSSFRRLGLLSASISLAVILAIALAAVQLAPTAEYLLQSQRASEVDYELGMTYSFWPWRLLTLLAPDMFGNPVQGDYWGYANYWEDANYIGLLPFILAISAIWLGIRKKKIPKNQSRLIRFLIVIIIFSFLLALGKNTPIFPWLYQHVPTFDMFQSPSRFTLWAIFSLSLLAGLGSQYWYRPTGRNLYWARLGTAGAAAVAIGAGLAWFVFGDISPSFIRSTALAGFWATTAGILTLLGPKGVARNKKFRMGMMGYYPIWSLGVGLIIAADLIVAGWGLNPGIDMDLYQGKSRVAGDLEQLLEGGRIYLPAEEEYQIKFKRFFKFDSFQPNETWSDLRSTMLPNLSLLDNIPSANNFDPLLPKRYSAWIEYLDQTDPLTQTQLLNLMGVKVVEKEDETQVYGVQFESRKALARFRWVPCAIIVPNGDIALQKVASTEFDPEEEIILEENDYKKVPVCHHFRDSIVSVMSENPNEIIVQVESSQKGYLILADTWYPGWKAWVDGKEVPVLRANFLFRAVDLSPGSHEVIFAYQPIWFYVGAAVSVITLFVLGFFLLWVRR